MDPSPPSSGERTWRFPRGMRLKGRRAFAAVYRAKVRTSIGPLLIASLPNDLPHPRLGLSVSRRVGSAVRRNRVKRLLREAFRFAQHDWQRGFDVLIIVRPHKPLTLAEYQRILAKAIHAIERKWEAQKGMRDSQQAGDSNGDAQD